MESLMSIMAFVQGRMGSTRLPGKVLFDLRGKSVIERVIERAAQARRVDEVVFLTTIAPADLALVALCASKKIRVFCGSEDDVLDRFYQAARLLKPSHIVRITADCPVIDPGIIDHVIERHIASQADYTSNTLVETYPDGEDVEVVAYEALKTAWEKASLSSEREHVTLYFRNHPEMFDLFSVQSDNDNSALRWTLDTPQDYVFLSKVYDELGAKSDLFGMREILDLLNEKPELNAVNAGIKRNEGLLKSLREDKPVSGGL